MYVYLDDGVKSFARKKKKHRSYDENSVMSISSKITIARTNSRVELSDVSKTTTWNGNQLEKDYGVGDLKNRVFKIRSLFNNQLIVNIVHGMIKKLVFYKKVMILHFYIWKLLFLWVYRKTKLILTKLFWICKFFLLPLMK